MAIFRAKKERYVNVDVKMLSDKNLSWKAKGVLAFALSRSEDWVFSVRGLAYYGKDGPDSVKSALKELEKAGYLERKRIRNKGKITAMEYSIFESPELRKALLEAENAPEELKPADNTPEGNAPEDSTQVRTMDLPITDVRIIDLTYNQSIYTGENVKEKIRSQIEYDRMCERYDRRLLDNLVAVMESVVRAKAQTIKVGKDNAYPTDYVIKCLEKINPLHIEQIMESLKTVKPTIRNPRGYLLTALINAANTMDLGYEYGEY